MKVLVKVGVSVALFAAILLFVPWSEFTAAFARVSGYVWLVALGGFILGHLAGTMKWRLLVRAGGAPLGRADAVMCYAAGLFANLALPTVVGGDVLRATLAGRVTRSGHAAVWGSVFDRISDLVATVALIGVGALLSRSALPVSWQGAISPVLLVAVLAGGLVATWLAARTPLSRWPRRVRRAVGRALATVRRSFRSPTVALGAFGISLGMQGAFTFLASTLGQSVGIHVPFAAWLLAWPLAKISGLMPISLGGLAVREAALATLLVPFGVPFALGVVASLLWQSIMISGALVGGLAWVVLARQRGQSLSLATVTPSLHP